jgi:hypothetical protein
MPLPQRTVSQKPPQGWSFTVTEVTAGMYRVKGVGPDGLTIERHGPDDDLLLDRLIADSIKLSSYSGRE